MIIEMLAKRKRQTGIGMVELLLAICLMSIVSVGVGGFFLQSMSQYFDIRARTELVQSVEWSARLMQKELHRAAPRSLRSELSAIEFLHIADAGRYRAGSGVDSSGVPQGAQGLAIGQAIDSFNITGRLNDINLGSLPDYRLMIAPETPGSLFQEIEANEQIGPISSPQSLVITSGSSEDNIALQAGNTHTFVNASSGQHVFLINTAIQYRCDLSNGNLIRYSAYTPSATIVEPNDGESTILLENLVDCSFEVLTRDLAQSYSEVVSVIQVADKSQSETLVRLVIQTQVENQR